ncbi:MAG: ATP-binding cassette domain-containing protein [Bifidobacteriaceae bacterium]|jgi:ABC-type sulfate/molybdate transport systems ATPase subunit|nr:ATP-binding cassette domain-containing protein [Bifidobacteriaceae bacterium]
MSGVAVKAEVRLGRGELDLVVDLDLAPGDRCVLAGANGSGKSTLLKVLAGLVNPVDGRIEIDGVAAAGAGVKPTRPEHRSVGYLPQERAIFPHLTVWGNVAYPLRGRGLRRNEVASRTEEMVQTFGLTAIAALPGAHLSGGQAARTGLARALAGDPGLLLLDEPFAALDPSAVVELRELLAGWLDQTGQTCLMVSHDLDDAQAGRGRVIVLAEGRILTRQNRHY